jgi:nucleotide-binding universal stress UspA family protein
MSVNHNPTVLIPFNFDFESKAALDFAAEHVKDYKYNIILLHVIERSEKLADIIVKDNVIHRVENELKSLVKHIKDENGDIKVKVVVKTGKPYKEILNVTEEFKADFILMGTREREEKAITSPKLGSVAGKIIRYSPIPVITFREGNLGYVKNILLPLDFSKRVQQKVNQAIRLAKAFNATVHVISIVWKKKEKIGKRSLEQMERTVKKLENEGVKTVSEFISTRGGGKKMFLIEILKYAHNHDIDLIMIMTQSEKPLIKYFIGASAFAIVRKSSTPVLTITPKYVEAEID